MLVEAMVLDRQDRIDHLWRDGRQGEPVTDLARGFQKPPDELGFQRDGSDLLFIGKAEHACDSIVVEQQANRTASYKPVRIEKVPEIEIDGRRQCPIFAGRLHLSKDGPITEMGEPIL
jgi:hypothetical protein